MTHLHALIEQANYDNDIRSRGAPTITLTLDDGTEHALPTRWVICYACEGEGRHVRTSVDCNGLTAEDFDQDPEFAEQYFSGAYDEQCGTCHGRTTIREVDLERLSPELREAYEHQEREEREYQALCRAERRMGA